MAITIRAAVAVTVSSPALRNRPQLSSPCTAATRQARNAPMAPASVGVKMPPNRPPKMPTITSRIGQVPFSAAIFSDIGSPPV